MRVGFVFVDIGVCLLGGKLLYLFCREQLSPILKHTNMKSRISIEIDFDNNNLPVIQIISTDSDDVRDKLLKSFLQSLQHTSRWCRIEYKGDFGSASMTPNSLVDYNQRWYIIPITPKELEDEIKLMEATKKEYQKSLQTVHTGQ